MPVTVKVDGMREMTRRFGRLDSRMRSAVGVWLIEASQVVVKEAVRLIKSGPKTGRVYRRYRPTRVHQASAPFQPPAEDLGELSGSLSATVDRKAMEAAIVSTSHKAVMLELGTRKMMPRPFLAPSIDNTRARISRMLSLRLKRLMKNV